MTHAPWQEGRPFLGQLPPGARVGRYQILGAIGRGGMGEVYAAYHPDLDRRIALKVVAGAGGGTGERRVRLLREARAIARLSHPNVITVHDAGTFGDRVFIAMELIDGPTIDQWLRAAPRTWRAIVDVFVAAGRGLAAAHAAEVIHRDFKPQNVMIARDGGVRVMDFGLARLTAEETEGADHTDEDVPKVRLTNVTKTGSFVGTPAYMSPEQFRRESIDTRSDQFSFCVALHEALFGTRPPSAPGGRDGALRDSATTSRRAAIPGWLRAVVLRGAAAAREQRYPSMNALLAALDRGRTSLRRRVSVAAVALSALVVSAGAWRVAHGNRFACAVPEDRLATVWSARDASNPRRQAIHHAFATSGRPTAETSWERLSKVLDEYVAAWGAMYLQACEATHVRGEQSAEVLDLRMSCLNDNLDQVRALTDELLASNANALSNAVAAAQGVTPVSRCGDVALLRSAVAVPRDDRTLREVQRLRRSLTGLQTLVDIGDFAGLSKRSSALMAEVKATGYKPLLAELLNFVALAKALLDPDPSSSAEALREALLLAEAARDDLTAAKVASYLSHLTGYRLGRTEEAEFWARFGHAVLDRVGGDQSRLRSWLDVGAGGALARAGQFERARLLMERSVRLRERSLGTEHPDYASGLGQLAYVLTHGEHPAEGLDVANRSIAIFLKHSDPDAFNLGDTYANQGEALCALGHYAEAEIAFHRALDILSKNVGRAHPETAFALHGLGETSLALGTPTAAVEYFEEALRVRRHPYTDPMLAAESAFGLARALSASHRDRRLSLSLAREALATYRRGGRKERITVESWLARHAKQN